MGGSEAARLTELTYHGDGWSPACRRRDHVGVVAARVALVVLRGQKPDTETCAMRAGVSLRRARDHLRRLRDAGWCEQRRGAWRLTTEGMRAVNAWVRSRDWQRARK